MVLFALALAGALFLFASWPIGQFYAITAVAVVAMWIGVWWVDRASRPPGVARIQFGLRGLLFWTVPYVALAALIVSWKGPYDKDFLNANAKSGALMVLTQVWVSIMFVRLSRRRKHNEKLNQDHDSTHTDH